jgi:hypothetical protein
MKNIVGPDDIRVGDYIVITGATSDDTGIVQTIADEQDKVIIELATKEGLKKLQIKASSILHILQTAEARQAAINLRKHHEYERGLKDMTKRKYPKDGRPEHGPVEDSEKSKLPTSKMSLNLRHNKKADNVGVPMSPEDTNILKSLISKYDLLTLFNALSIIELEMERDTDSGLSSTPTWDDRR